MPVPNIEKQIHMKFSALLCLYHANDPIEVRQAIDSAFLTQTLPPAELVIVFDGPVPSTVAAVIDEFAKTTPTQIIKFEKNQGHGPARAAGLESCTYNWVAIIDADDISLPNRFEILLPEIQDQPDLAVIGAGLTEFTEKNGQRELGATRIYPSSFQDICQYLKSRSPIAQPTCMLNRKAILAVGNYQSWFNNEDYHLWIRLVSEGYKMKNIAKPVLLFRTSENVYQRRGGLKYWWNEVRLQIFSLSKGTTSLPKLISGAAIRFAVQVLMPNSLRAYVYKKMLR